MASDLTEYLRGRKPRGFQSRPFYSHAGDYLTFFFEDEDHYAERMDEYLTVFRSMEGDRFVGFKLKGVAYLLDAIGDFCVDVYDGTVLKLSLLLAAGAMITKEPSAIPTYQDFAEKTRDIRLTKRKKELVPA
jgi:hypothetical protein